MKGHNQEMKNEAEESVSAQYHWGARMEILASSAVLLVIIAVLVYVFVTRSTSSPGPYPPGPRGWELVKAHWMALNGTLPLHLEEWSRKYGDVVFCPLLVGKFLFLNTPSATKELYGGMDSAEFANDRTGSYVADKMCKKKCLTFCPASVPCWAKMRKLMRAPLKLYGEGGEAAELEEVMRDTLDKTMTTLDTGREHDVLMKEVVHDFNVTMITVVLTGEVHEADSELCQTIRWFNECVVRIVEPSFDLAVLVLPFLDRMPLAPHCLARRELLASKEAVLDLLLKDHLASRKPGSHVGIVDKLLEHQSNEGADWMTNDHLEGLLMDVLRGGVTPPTFTITTLLFHLLHHPDVTRKIQDELDRVVGRERKPVLSDRPSCPYTEAAVLESMRSVPLLPLGLNHLITRDLPFRGWVIPQGAVAYTGAYAYNQSPDLWEDPHTFTPERFLDDMGKLLPPSHPSRQNMLSFGTGKRVCLGQKMAHAWIFMFLTWLLQSFDILPPRTHDLLPMDIRGWNQGVMDGSHLKPYHCRLGRRK
ncbi:hypothetical protein ACOMHN_034867 [Nucella lapillus]